MDMLEPSSERKGSQIVAKTSLFFPSPQLREHCRSCIAQETQRSPAQLPTTSHRATTSTAHLVAPTARLPIAHERGFCGTSFRRTYGPTVEFLLSRQAISRPVPFHARPHKPSARPPATTSESPRRVQLRRSRLARHGPILARVQLRLARLAVAAGRRAAVAHLGGRGARAVRRRVGGALVHGAVARGVVAGGAVRAVWLRVHAVAGLPGVRRERPVVAARGGDEAGEDDHLEDAARELLGQADVGRGVGAGVVDDDVDDDVGEGGEEGEGPGGGEEDGGDLEKRMSGGPSRERARRKGRTLLKLELRR